MSVLKVTLDNFESEVVQSEKPVLIDFWATWCGPCRMFSPIVDEVAEEVNDVVIAKCNVDDNPELAQRFGIMSIPTIVLLKNGEVQRTNSGALSKQALLDWINK